MSASPASTAEIYDAQAQSWGRGERLLLSDFTARPYVMEALGDLRGAKLLDLGCGEGYVARLAARAGVRLVHGFDISAKMVAEAQASRPTDLDCEMTFSVADASRLDLPEQAYSHAMAVFLFNYITRAEMVGVLKNVRRALQPGGCFAITVPHPSYAFMRQPAAPFYFDMQGENYFSAVDKQFEGRIWRRDGQDVHVRAVHKTLTDYFAAFAAAGWSKMPLVRELCVSAADVELDPAFFGPIQGFPLHILFKLEM